MPESFAMRQARKIAAQTLYGLSFSEANEPLGAAFARALPVIEESVPDDGSETPLQDLGHGLTDVGQLVEVYRQFLKEAKQQVEKNKLHLANSGCNLQIFWRFFKKSRNAINSATENLNRCAEMLSGEEKGSPEILELLASAKRELATLLEENHQLFRACEPAGAQPSENPDESGKVLCQKKGILDDYARILAWELARGVQINREKLKDLVKRFSHNWRVERMGVIELVIIELGLYELIFHKTPVVDVCDEMVRLADEFGARHAISFIKGVLDAAAKANIEIA